MTPAEKLAATKRPLKQRARKKDAKKFGPWKCRIRDLREELDLSIHRVAEGIGMSAAGLHQIECGGDPMLSTAIKISAFFGVPIESIWSKK